MMSRYAHIRAKARREAIAMLEAEAAESSVEVGSPQNPPQSMADGSPMDLTDDPKTLLNQRVSDPTHR
jgi:hypothetical protein